MRFYKATLIVLGFLIELLVGILPIGNVLAQATAGGSFYAIAQNDTTQLVTIWRIDSATNTAISVYSLSYFNQFIPNNVLSEREKAAIQTAVNKGMILVSRPMTAGMSQYLDAVWQLDETNLLIQTSTYLCNPLLPNACFGYYELSKVNILSPTNVQSLVKLDYHHAILDQWTGCNDVGYTIYIDDLLINPVKSNFAFTIKAYKDCYGDGKTHAFIANYGQSPASLTEIPLADGLSWSPDGSQLAYYARETCPSFEGACPVSVEVYAVMSDTTTTVRASSDLLATTRPVTAWKDNTTLLYQWSQATPDSYNAAIVEHNLSNGASTETVTGVSHIDRLYRLGGGTETLFGYLDTTKQAIQLSMKDWTATTHFEPTYAVFYNSRFPIEVVLSQQNIYFDSILAVNSSLQQSQVNLAESLPANEKIIYATPAVTN